MKTLQRDTFLGGATHNQGRIQGGGLKFARSAKNLNCKFKTFGILDTLKVHIQSNYPTSSTLSLLQTKLAEKKNYFFMFFTLQFQILNCDRFTGLWGHCPLAPPPLYALPHNTGRREGRGEGV